MRSVSHNLNRPLQGPEEMDPITFSAEQITSFSQAFVLGSGSSIPDGNGLNDGSVEVNHHCLWQVKLLQLPQEVHPLLCFNQRAWELHKIMAGGGAGFFLKSITISAVFIALSSRLCSLHKVTK